MIKKLFRFFRNLIITGIWSWVFLSAANLFFYSVWRFNLVSAHSWETISYFWSAGGIIKNAKDYIFLLALLSLPFIWFFSLRRLIRTDFLDFFLSPLKAYNRRIIKKYGHNSSRIVLKNLKSSQQIIEEVKNQLESIKPEKPKEVVSIRDKIQSKLESENK